MIEHLEKYIEIIDMIAKNKNFKKKNLQKWMYLIERKGVDLNLNHTMHFYGPYSSKLDDITYVLEVENIIKEDLEAKAYVIKCNKANYLCEEEKIKIKFIIDKFISYDEEDLEVVTTIDYVANFLLNKTTNYSEIIEKVRYIKGNSFSETQLDKNMEFLKSSGLLA